MECTTITRNRADESVLTFTDSCTQFLRSSAFFLEQFEVYSNLRSLSAYLACEQQFKINICLAG